MHNKMNNDTEDSNDFSMEMWSDFLEEYMNKESLWIRVLFILSLCIIFFVSLIGNLLTCIVIYYDKTMHTATNYYLFNLAISDLIVTFAILMDIPDHLTDYPYSDLVCKMHFFFVVALWNNSILIMTALAIERYIAIFYPLLLQSTCTRRRVMKIIVLILMVAILETLPELWTAKLIKTQRTSICFTVPTTFARLANGILAVFTFVIPLTIMTFVYGMIAFKVSSSEKTNSKKTIFNHRKNRGKVNKLVVAITVSFVVCWLPFSAMRVLLFVCNVRQLMLLKQWWGYLIKIFSLNSWFSIVLNPILFSLMSTKFRMALKTLWNGKFHNNTITHTNVI